MTLNHEILQGKFELKNSNSNNSYKKTLKLRPLKKQFNFLNNTSLSIRQFPNNEVLGFTKKKHCAGRLFGENPTIKTHLEKAHLNCNCIDLSIVNSRRELSLFHFSFKVPSVVKIVKEPTSISGNNVSKRKIGEITFFFREIMTVMSSILFVNFTVLLLKT